MRPFKIQCASLVSVTSVTNVVFSSNLYTGLSVIVGNSFETSTAKPCADALAISVGKPPLIATVQPSIQLFVALNAPICLPSATNGEPANGK